MFELIKSYYNKLTKENTMSVVNVDNFSKAAQAGTQYVLAPLPYANNALEPVITANTLSFHYGNLCG